MILEVSSLDAIVHEEELLDETVDDFLQAQESNQECDASNTTTDDKTNHEPKEKIEYKCDHCDNVYAKRYILNKHMKKHIMDRDYECSICGKEFKNVGSMRKHMYRHENTDKPNECDICGKMSPNPTALRSHKQFVHMMQKTFKCPICHKAFKRGFTLQEHLTTHTGDTLYKCPYCTKTFNSSANMHSHKKKMHPKEWEKDRSEYLKRFEGENNTVD
uniref:C2H2-type domain-containing protein n=1 Tax=Anopheles farauti TaxID=69004 RepID=A0A182QK49_9DIPT